MKPRTIFAALTLLLLGSLTAAAIDPNKTPLTFQYEYEQFESFRNCPSPNKTVTTNEFTKLNEEATYLIRTTDLSPIDQTILPAYLANAMKDYAWISYRLTGKFSGSLGPVTLWTLRLFIPDATLPSVNTLDFDPFSSGIAALVVSRASSRLREERKQIARYPIKRGKNRWTPTSPGYRGLEYGTAKTWYLRGSDEVVVANPEHDHAYWMKESEEIVSAMENRDGKETERVFWWANLSSPNAGDWSALLQDYFTKANTPLADRLFGKALYESAFLDSNAAAFNSKYTYWIPRPSQTNPKIKPLIAIPNHPSYPSAHSTIAATVAVVLNELFPDNKKEWNALAEEAGMSRIWGGIHYPADHLKGVELGEKIGLIVNERSH